MKGRKSSSLLMLENQILRDLQNERERERLRMKERDWETESNGFQSELVRRADLNQKREKRREGIVTSFGFQVILDEKHENIQNDVFSLLFLLFILLLLSLAECQQKKGKQKGERRRLDRERKRETE